MAGRLQAISDFVAVISGARGREDVLRLVASASRQALGATQVTLSQWDRARGVLRTVATDRDGGSDQEDADEAYVLVDSPAVERVLLGATGYVVSAGSPDLDPVSCRRFERSGTTSGVAAPIVVDGDVWGELWAGRANGEREFTDTDLQFARTVADHAAAGVRQADHLERVERLAYTDELTGLANRRAFDDRLALAVTAHQQEGRGLAVIVADVNGLKRINDGQGHQAGDAALVRFAGSLTEITAGFAGTRAARLSGDEFAVLCEGLTAEAAIEVATQVADRSAEVLPEGAACGLALAPGGGFRSLTPARILRAADTAQYRAKEARSRAPVVVGADGGLELALPGPAGHERRALRDHRDHPSLLDTLVAAIDSAQPDTVPSRLEAVARAATAAFDADRWAVCEGTAAAPGPASDESAVQLAAGGLAVDGTRWTVVLQGTDRIRVHATTLRAAVAIALQP